MTPLRALVAVVLTAGPAAADVCEIRGQDVTLEGLVVRPPGAEALELDVSGVAAVARLAGNDVKLEVTGALAFTASAKPSIWYTVTSAVDAGLVKLARGAHVVGQRASGGVLIGQAVLHASDVMPGENKQPDVHVDNTRVACAQLSLDWSADDVDDPPLRGDGTSWTSRGATLEVFASPKPRAASVVLRAGSCEGKGCLSGEILERKGAWVKVGASNEHASVVGWVPARKIVSAPEAIIGYSYMCTGDHRRAGFTQSFGLGVAQPQPARIKRDTPVYASPKVGAWARVLVEDGYQVRYAPGDAWAEVTEIPGVTLTNGRTAYVPVSALLPATP